MATNEDMLLNLMQNISDDLENIKNTIGQLEHTKKENKTFIESQRKLFDKQLKKNQEDFHKVISDNPPIINETQNSHYILFGKDSPFSSKFLLSLIAVILISIPVLKYLPPFLNERSILKEERDVYKLFYEYTFLKSFDKTHTIPDKLIKTIQGIEARDSTYINQIHRLNTKYSNFIRKEQLKAQLKELEK